MQRWAMRLKIYQRELTADALAESMLEPSPWPRVRQQAPELIKPMLDVLDKIINTFRQQAGDDMSITPYLKEVETMRNRLADEYRSYLTDIKAGKVQAPGEVAAKQTAQTAFKMDNMTTEGIKAAEIARRLTDETAAKDIAAGVEFSVRDNYIKHLYKENTSAQALWKKYTGIMKPNTKASFQKERKFDTYKDFEEWAATAEGVNLTPVYDAQILTQCGKWKAFINGPLMPCLIR